MAKIAALALVCGLIILGYAAADDCSPKSLGCWTDTGDRAIAGGIRLNSNDPIKDCYNYARDQGFSVFAVQYNTECFTAANAAETYDKYGGSSGCSNGRGGSWAQNVYKVACEDDCSPKSLGCWTDTGDRAIAGGIRLNSNDPIKDCYNYAREQGFSVFAVQYNTECFTAANAAETYDKYGGSSGCSNGRGGTWAQNVYKIAC
ncbi:hypothetical protein ACHWQZ_G014288 [Mnemiopsis leidyi]